ncbi:hypothetical protein [Streptomyces scabiei]|uniref:hypothetical protein n=1 Tax=Streptomyces scabiei TaxID=1930 RepID=UPI001B333452|nr:hypothetical protein [Streptomyces sp. LBUM 1488]MBP5904617.1 hypothetical protein [Streptomyces sp. LBUM 1488]
MQITEMRNEAATLLRAVRTEKGERREHMLEEARLWIDLAQIAADDVPDVPVPDGTVMRIRTRSGSLTAVMEAREEGVRVYPWTCLGCGSSRDFGTSSRKDAREEATRHARGCWVLPEPADDAQAKTLSAA